jgi:KEOPS complex subunit Pcc1
VTSRRSASSNHDAVLTLEYATVERARRIERSLRPEVGEIDGDRTQVGLERDGPVVTVAVEASDRVALRAGLNTWLSLAAVAESAGGVGG